MNEHRNASLILQHNSAYEVIEFYIISLHYFVMEW